MAVGFSRSVGSSLIHIAHLPISNPLQSEIARRREPAVRDVISKVTRAKSDTFKLKQNYPIMGLSERNRALQGLLSIVRRSVGGGIGEISAFGQFCALLKAAAINCTNCKTNNGGRTRTEEERRFFSAVERKGSASPSWLLVATPFTASLIRRSNRVKLK